jgi:hypothetical protein
MKVEHDYAVRPGRARASIGRVRVLAVREELCGAVTLRDARAEGHRTTADFKVAWVLHHDCEWAEKAQGSEPEEAQLLTRFEARHADRLVHVVTFTAAPDQPLLLASQMDILAGRCESGEYTHSRARAVDDLEVIPASDGYVERAREKGKRMRAVAQADSEEAWRARRRVVRARRIAMFRSPGTLRDML